MATGTKLKWGAMIVLIVIAVCLIVLMSRGWFVRPAPTFAPAIVILRLHGSSTIGLELAPALAVALLEKKHANDISVIRNSIAGGAQILVQGRFTAGGTYEAIEIRATKSGDGFQDLRNNQCDVALSSRAIKPPEEVDLADLGTMTSPACEHVMGLDGVAIVVNKKNPIPQLSKTQLVRIFGKGGTTQWKDLEPNFDHDIKICARPDDAGTYDLFQSKVLGSVHLVDTPQRYDTNRDVSDCVSGDDGAIGFVGLPFIAPNRAVAISEVGDRFMMPTQLTVKLENYWLSRRLYLYTPARLYPDDKNFRLNPSDQWAREFVDFALSKRGQDVVTNTGFVNLDPAEDDSLIHLAPNFRFRSNSSDLDTRAQADLHRIVDQLATREINGEAIDVLLFGFADNTGASRQHNCELSQRRAQVLADMLKNLGVEAATAVGFCEDLPVLSNDTEGGRQTNRRVEVWLKIKRKTMP